MSQPDNTTRRTNWEQEIHDALKEPVSDPGEDFTRSVLSQIDDGERQARPVWNRQLAVFSIAAALLVVAVIALRPDQAAQPSATEEILQLAREQRALARELEDLQQRRLSAEPVIYLGGDDTVEFVYALNDPGFATNGPVNNNYRTANQ